MTQQLSPSKLTSAQAKPIFKILVCGDRSWDDYPAVYFGLYNIQRERKLTPKDITIIEGGGTGADAHAQRAAASLGYNRHSVPAKWSRYHEYAGPKRNTELIKLKPDLVLAFHSYLPKSKGTKDCVNKAIKAQIPVRLWDGSFWSDLTEVVK